MSRAARQFGGASVSPCSVGVISYICRGWSDVHFIAGHPCREEIESWLSGWVVASRHAADVADDGS